MQAQARELIDSEEIVPIDSEIGMRVVDCFSAGGFARTGDLFLDVEIIGETTERRWICIEVCCVGCLIVATETLIVHPQQIKHLKRGAGKGMKVVTRYQEDGLVKAYGR